MRNYAIAGWHLAADRCVRTRKWSLIKRKDGNELYDLEKDPEEKENLAKEKPEKAKNLSNQVARLDPSVLLENKEKLIGG